MTWPVRAWPVENVFRRYICGVVGCIMALVQAWKCSRGNHGTIEPGGHCVCCGNKVRLGRGDEAVPDGCMVVFRKD